MLYHVKLFLHILVLPPCNLLLVALLGFYLSRRRPRLGQSLAFVAVLALGVLSMPVVSSRLLRRVETVPALDVHAPPAAQAIVVLGGGAVRAAPEYGGVEAPTADTLARLSYGVFLSRQWHLPLLLSGSPAEAHGMAQVLTRDFSLDARWVDDSASDTYTNAQHAAVLLRRDGVQRVLVVTDAAHTPRALAEFRATGLTAVGAPTGFRTRDDGLIDMPAGLLPSSEGLVWSTIALREMIGQWVREPMARVHALVDAHSAGS
jgi:uncharacterized SAM-binding protein YcdF (DUF218 family)